MAGIVGIRNQVDKAFFYVERKVKESLKKTNREAARLLSKGDYEGMEALVQAGKNIQSFQSELADLRTKWGGLSKQGKKPKRSGKEENTPLWAYYQPILRVLVELGGTATRRDIENALERHLPEFAKKGDYEIMGNGSPRWKVMIRHSRRPMTKEGFLDATKKGVWSLTPVGRQAAQGKRSGTEKAGTSV